MKFQFLFGLVSRSLFVTIFDSKSGRLGVSKLGFSIESFAKTTFRGNRFFMGCGVGFCRFGEALGAAFLIFSALEAGLKIECFSRSPCGDTDWHQYIKTPADPW